MKDNPKAQSWRAAILPATASIQEAIFSLETSGLQIVLVVSNDEKLIGTATDGDIRRGFLKGMTLASKLDNVMNRNPLVVTPDISRDLVIQLMQANKIHQLPVVNTEGKVVGLQVWDSVVAPPSFENTMVIMAGGQGTRLRPHTEHCPKPMLEVGGKPMLEHIIARAKSDGFRNFIISLHYLGHMIEEHFGDGRRLGVNINYLKEDAPLGTAGCLSILERKPELPLVVTNGDVLSDIHYCEMLDFHTRHNAIATMAVRQHEIQNQFGVVKTKGMEIEGFEEKPIYRSHINAGIYVISPEALKCLEVAKHCDMPTLFQRIKRDGGKAIVYPMHEPWLDVGRQGDLDQAQKSFQSI